MTNEEKHIADYFIISGVSDDFDPKSECKQLINSVLPITDVTVIFKSLGEECPIGYTCIETTPCGHSADLNNGNFKSQNILICYRRGNDKPPLVDVGVYHEDKERVLPDVEVVYKTPYGRCASTGAIGSKSGTFITYRRAKTNHPFNQLVVVDLCVILNNKGEKSPHAFYPIKKNLNKSYYGMIGSEVFLCYKKTLLSPPSLCFRPQIISRFPLQDYKGFPLPETVPLFCLPAGAKIEAWPSYTPLTRPTVSTFILTSDSAQKMYGSSYCFYEPFDKCNLTSDQRRRLNLELDDQSSDLVNTNDDEAHSLSSDSSNEFELFAIKSICILSRWPFFDCFEKFLIFLHRLVCNPDYFSRDSSSSQQKIRSCVPLEHYISHFLLDVSFPTPQRPTVLVQLMPGSDETVTISQPSSSLPLPLTGASFCQLLSIMGVDSTMNLLLFGLSEQKILLHSLHPNLLTGVAEAITAMLFPFHWQCPYVPLCPLSLHGILNAPLPFIVGIDSRCFDTFNPPSDIISIDLDTKAIYLSELKKCLNLRILPKRPARVLRSTLEKIYQKLIRFQLLGSSSQSLQHKSLDTNRQNIEKAFELEIQEAFLRFMVSILRGFRSYLLPITSAPTVGATDPTSLFNFEGFLMSRDRSYGQFYHLITKTQMFTHYIEERSFVSDKTTTSLAFFDDCEEKLCSSGDIFSEKPVRLFDTNNSLIQTDRSVYIPAPDQSPSVSHSTSLNNASPPINDQDDPVESFKFGPLNPTLFHRHPQALTFAPMDQTKNPNYSSPSRGGEASIGNILMESKNSFSITRRTKQEVKYSQKFAKKSSENPLAWSKYLASSCFSLWFATLPSYINYCNMMSEKFSTTSASQNTTNNNNGTTNNNNNNNITTSRILRHAHSILVKMQKLQLNPDEICFRVLTLLCGHYGQPALAVRVFFEMKKAGIKPNAVTYGYYNKAVLECKWPDHSSKPTTVLWIKIRNVISGISLFKQHGRIRMDKKKRKLALEYANRTQAMDEVDRSVSISSNRYNNINSSSSGSTYFKPTTVPLSNLDSDSNSAKNYYLNNTHHRRSLVNRKFNAHQNSSLDINAEHLQSSDGNQLSRSKRHHPSSIQKSHSMHLRNESPERLCSNLVYSRSSSLEDDEESPVVSVRNIQPEGFLRRRQVNLLNEFSNLEDKLKLLDEPNYTTSCSSLIHRVNPFMIGTTAGLLFTSNLDSLKFKKATHSARTTTTNMPPNNLNTDHQTKQMRITNQSSDFLLSSSKSHHHTPTSCCDKNEILEKDCYGEDAQILLKLDPVSSSQAQEPDLSSSILNLRVTDNIENSQQQQIFEEHHNDNDDDDDEQNEDDSKTSFETSKNDLNIIDCDVTTCSTPNSKRHATPRSLSVVKASDSRSSTTSDEDPDDAEHGLLKNITSTPTNFKLASLINDASNLQWSKWTSSQNSKNVYKGIKSAATGFVSSTLQELKSSFSMSNTNTPHKAHNNHNNLNNHNNYNYNHNTSHKSTNATREMLSQWANYFSSQTPNHHNHRANSDADSDYSEASNDLFKLSNDEDVELSTAEACDYKYCHKYFEALEKYYGNSSAKEDLIDHDTHSRGGTSTASKVDMDHDHEQYALEIGMTTCSKCTLCHSLLYDEEIMERWSYNDSNLNTRCIYCRAKIVPLMTVEIIDFRFKEEEDQHEKGQGLDMKKRNSDTLVDIDDDEDTSQRIIKTNDSTEVPKTTGTIQSQSKEVVSKSKDSKQTIDDESNNDIIVPYLSPIVLRKELENVFESSSDLCATSSRFVDEHPIIFWNLLWYFTRINIPTHLAFLCLNSTKISKGKLIPSKWIGCTNVLVKTLWDNEKLHNEIGQPLYRLWSLGDPSTLVEAVLSDKIVFNTTSLNHVIDLIRANDLQNAMATILNARLKSSSKFSFNKNRHNLYRDLMFLILISLDSAKFFMDNYERQYRKAFESLNFQQVALNRFDRPPTIGSVFCRKAFRELTLSERM